MITPGHNGFLADFLDPGAIADQTMTVLRDPAAFAPIRRNAARFIRERYSVERVRRRMVSLYRATAPPAAGPGPVAMSRAPFWGGVIAPVLAAVRARRIVEIGAGRGDMTARLLAFARRHRAIVHVVDPESAFEV